jgi:predicted AAA+ superfamily ATPase
LRAFGKWLHAAHPAAKMLFLAGPRQVGKTTLARAALAAEAGPGIHLNWDVPADRRRMLSAADLLEDVRRPGARPLVVFDELHKMRRFKGWLKGFYDANRDHCRVWVTGSGRLDLYQSGGDSLVGRYFLYHMHPLSVGELARSDRALGGAERAWRAFAEGGTPSPTMAGSLQSLLRFGGFPEPYLRQNASFHRRWVLARRQRVTHEDIRDLTRIEDLDRLEMLVELLNPRIGAPLSINSLREDLGVAFETVRGWLGALQRVYYVYAVAPYSERVQRSLLRESKYYYWDWSEASEPGARFENLVMCHLKKACDAWTDFGHGRFQLWYLRDRERREVDALITKDRKPWCLVEAKRSDAAPSPHLSRFGAQLGCARLVQLVESPGVRKRSRIGRSLVHVASADAFLAHFA